MITKTKIYIYLPGIGFPIISVAVTALKVSSLSVLVTVVKRQEKWEKAFCTLTVDIHFVQRFLLSWAIKQPIVSSILFLLLKSDIYFNCACSDTHSSHLSSCTLITPHSNAVWWHTKAEDVLLAMSRNGRPHLLWGKTGSGVNDSVIHSSHLGERDLYKLPHGLQVTTTKTAFSVKQSDSFFYLSGTLLVRSMYCVPNSAHLLWPLQGVPTTPVGFLLIL